MKIFSVFQVSWDNLISNKFEFMNQLRMPTTVVDTWPYYEFEEYIKLLNKKNEEEKKRHEEEERQQKMNMPDVNKMSKGFTPPNFNMPNFKSPF